MKSKASFFSISIPIIKENLRRFWSIPALGTLIYFLCGVFPILMKYNDINQMYDYIEMCLSNLHPFFLATHLILPVITAVVVFRYLHSPSAVTAVHALPFTRSQLFNSSLISGFILTSIPLVFNELLLQLIAKPTYPVNIAEAYNSYGNVPEISPMVPTNIFTRMNVLDWFWQSLIIILVIYAIAVFAGMVTGTTIMHLALGFGFNFIMPALYMVFIEYCNSFLFGFTSTGAYEKILIAMTPFTQAIGLQENFSIGLQLYYFTLVIVLLITSYFLYQRRKLETSGDAIVFPFMIPTICYLIAFFGMSLLGYYFMSLCVDDNKEGYFYCGLAAGGFISFLIGRMIVFKTPRIFNKTTLKSFCIFALIATVFTTSITLDLFGFEDRVPVKEKVKAVDSLYFDFSDQWARYDIKAFKGYDPSNMDKLFHYKDPKNVEALINLHRSITDKKQTVEDIEKKNVQTYSLDLRYDITNPFGLQRRYYLTYDMVKSNKNLKQLYESQEFKDYFSLNNLNSEKIVSISLNNLHYYDYGSDVSSRFSIKESNSIKSLLAEMEKDYYNRTFEQHMNTLRPYCFLSIAYKDLDENKKTTDKTLDVKVLESDLNTIKWIKDNNLESYVVCTAKDIQKIIITEWNIDNEIKRSKNTKADTFRKELIITDKEQIQEVLDTFESYETDYDRYYEGTIIYKPSSSIDESFSKRIVYSYDTAPSFIKEFFN
ncbi:MAG: hypothetical protein ACK5MV_02885 [Aminipila sp.]